AALGAQAEAMMIPFHRQRDLLASIAGIGATAAAAVISEIGTTPAEFFTTSAHLASRAGLCPGNHEPAGKRKHGKPRKGSQHRQPLLAQCAWPAVRTNGRLKAKYHRRVPRLGGHRNPPPHKNAPPAPAHPPAPNNPPPAPPPHTSLVTLGQAPPPATPPPAPAPFSPPRHAGPETETQPLLARLQALGHKATPAPAA